MLASPKKIDLLPEHLIDQIKAGEVIERPGNLIKEILENAVDAGATKLELSLRNNGLDLISLKDNGHGMTFDDLPLAFSRHATSKINQFEDLYRLHSFGFRGEALASIAAISKVQCITHCRSEDTGSEIRIEGGLTSFHGKRTGKTIEHGTELVIQDLFFNTPVRLKFIQSQQSEKQFIRRILHAFLLSNPKIEFHIKWDEGEKEIFSATPDLQTRLEEMVPKAKGQILHSQRAYENNEVDVYLIPGQFKTPLKWQHLFINSRYILDKQLNRVLTSALEATFGTDDFHYIAFFRLPPDNIDVNVHPNKTIIKCFEISKLISLLTSTIKEMGSLRKSPVTSAPIENPTTEQAPQFFSTFQEAPSLLQERHAYNMEGFFSPHSLPQDKNENIIWLGNHFLKNEGERWLAISAPRLLKSYTESKLHFSSVTIPLLVSEPFLNKGISEVTLEKLRNSGLEFDYLGKETLVVRGIPAWMNGFPLKDILQSLFYQDDFRSIIINPADWSISTWEEMINELGVSELIKSKIACDLQDLLLEKFK